MGPFWDHYSGPFWDYFDQKWSRRLGQLHVVLWGWGCGAVGVAGLCGAVWGCVVVGLSAENGSLAWAGAVGFGALYCVAVLGSVWGVGVGLCGCGAVGCGAVGLWGCGAVGLWGWGCGCCAAVPAGNLEHFAGCAACGAVGLRAGGWRAARRAARGACGDARAGCAGGL